MAASNKTLNLSIYSFGYSRSGIPADPNGNGGGFVFDCRCLPNPGLFPAYQPLNGMDAPIIDYLEQQPEAATFFDLCHQLVQTAVQGHLSKGYTRLMVSFGCTGGQHRSVYMSERLKRAMQAVAGVQISLEHTEQAHWKR